MTNKLSAHIASDWCTKMRKSSQRVDTRRSIDEKQAASQPRTSGNQFFTDIEGLRGIAVTTVVLFHASVPFLTGGFIGVDLFFVISGFLITGLLLREFDRNGRISLKGFYARRARRIIPPAALVILCTSVAIWFLLPVLTAFKQAFDLLAAALNFANWRFIAQGRDYLADALSDKSAATHFWSLSVEEQFYFVWPLLVIGAAYVARRQGVSVRLVVGITMAIVSAVSFYVSVTLSSTDPSMAYMATHTRAWQFGVGALIAVVGPLLTGSIVSVSARVAMCALGWTGMVAIILACILFDHGTTYPGWAALLPTLGAGIVIASGQIAGNAGPSVGALLSMGWLRWIGNVSYSWYLWHWPIIVLLKERGITSWPVLVAAMLAALVLAWLSTSLVERPIMSSNALRQNLTASLAVGMAGIVVAVASTMSLGTVAVKVASATVSSSGIPLGFEQVFGADSGVTSGPVRPNPFQAFDDRPSNDKCIVPLTSDKTPEDCVYGPSGGVPAVVFGDSHAQQWLPALEAVAQENNLRLHQFTKSSCPAPALPAEDRKDPFAMPLCMNWRKDAIDRIESLKPKYVFVSSFSHYIPDYQEVKEAWDQTLVQLRATGAKMIYIRDTPFANFNGPDCISGALEDWSKCDFGQESAIPNSIEPILADQIRGENTDILVLDFNPYLCDTNTCHMVRNGILLYRDESHLTATAVRVLTAALSKLLSDKGILTPATQSASTNVGQNNGIESNVRQPK